MADPTITVSPPQRSPRKGGIEAVADFRTDNRLAAGVYPKYDADSCTVDLGDINLCYAPDVSPDDKSGEGIIIGNAIGATFGGYVGVECFMGPWDDYAQRARAALEQAQGRVVEAQISGWLPNGGFLTGATLAEVIAKLEQHADANYPGLPVLHLSRQNAVIAAAEYLIFPEGESGRLWTANGTPVVASGAYGPTDIRISGGITVLQSEVVVSQGYDLTHNRSLAVAERAFNIIVDCDYRVTGAVVVPPPTGPEE